MRHRVNAVCGAVRRVEYWAYCWFWSWHWAVWRCGGWGAILRCPNWARAQIDARLAELMPDATVRFGDMILVVDEGWRPRARVLDVQVVDNSGDEIVAFSEVRASLALRPLISGQLDVKSIDLSGVFATLRRRADGRITLSYGAGDAPGTREAASLPQLITELDELLLQPGLTALTRVEVRALTLRYEDEIAGRAWTADGGRLRLTRERRDVRISADLAVLGGGAQAATLEANYSGQIGSTASEFGVTIADIDAGDIATQSPAFGWLSALDAPISGSLRGGLDAQAGLLPLNAVLQIGAGVIQPTQDVRPIPIEGARSYISYVPQDQLLRFDELSVRSKWVSGRLEGEALLSGINDGTLTDLVGQFQLSDLQINPDALYPAPVNVSAAEMDFRLTLEPFALQVGRLQIVDQGQTLSASGTLGVDTKGWTTRVDAAMDAITPERLMTLWPVSVVPNTRDWLERNLVAGHLHDITFALRRHADAPSDTYLGFEFDKTNVRFLPTMPLIEEAKGQITLLRDRFVLSVDQGHVTAAQGGKIAMSGSSFIIPDVTVKGGTPAVVRLATRSSVTAALSMLNEDPLSVMDDAGLAVTLAQGSADLQGTLAFPLVREEGQKAPVEYVVSGVMRDVVSDQLVPGRRLAAPLLSVRATNTRVSIAGQGTLDGVPFDADWTQATGSAQTGVSTVTGQIELSPETLDAFAIDLPAGMVTGSAPADVIVELAKGKPPAFSLDSALNGVALNITPVGWAKPATTPGRLSVTGNLGPVPQIDSLVLRGPGMAARGRVALRADGGLDTLQIDRLTVGDWLDAPVDLLGRGPGAPVGVAVRGGTLDLRNAQFGSGGGSSAPMTAAFDQVRITDTISLRDVRSQFTASGGLDGAFTGKINGGTEVTGRLIPQSGRTALRLTSQDAGGVFASAGVLKQARGGAMELTLVPVGTGGAFDGQLKVADTRIQDAPVMAALLNAISIVGLLDELGGNGIFFSDVAARFRMTPSRITLTEASAVGTSMGISMDGVFATDTGQLSLQGVISPVYLLNGLGSFLTRRGEGLIGFNYTVTGDAKDPDVSVNPLSALTPGMFRELFRAPPPDVPRVEGEVLPEPSQTDAPTAPTQSNPPLVSDDVGR